MRFVVHVEIFALFTFRNHPASAAVCLIPFCILTPSALNTFTKIYHSKDVILLKVKIRFLKNLTRKSSTWTPCL